MTNVIKLKSYDFTGKESLLLDANVLLYLFGPHNSGNDHGYSDFLEKALLRNVEMYVNESVLSEFVNRNCRLAYKQFLKNHNFSESFCDYKRTYRKSEDFKKNYKLSIDIIESEILSIAKFSANTDREINVVLSSYELLDFNDELIIRNAEVNGFGIVTHDRDFLQHSSNVSIYQY